MFTLIAYILILLLTLAFFKGVGINNEIDDKFIEQDTEKLRRADFGGKDENI